MNILIVDDEPTIVECLTELLGDCHNVISTICPLNAIELMKLTPIDVIITDYNMPKMDGYELAEYAMIAYSTNSIIITGNTDLVIDNTMIVVLHKPISFVNLLKTISTFEESRSDASIH